MKDKTLAFPCEDNFDAEEVAISYEMQCKGWKLKSFGWTPRSKFDEFIAIVGMGNVLVFSMCGVHIKPEEERIAGWLMISPEGIQRAEEEAIRRQNDRSIHEG